MDEMNKEFILTGPNVDFMYEQDKEWVPSEPGELIEFNEEVKKTTKFHIKLDTEMLGQIEDLPLFQQKQSFSGTIRRILELLCPQLESEHITNVQRWSKYELIHPDLSIERKNLSVYMPYNLYKRLKLVHQNLDSYSIALMVREMIREYFGLREEFGDEVDEKLEKGLIQWNEYNAYSKENVNHKDHLILFSYLKSEKSTYVVFYDDRFAPIIVYRL